MIIYSEITYQSELYTKKENEIVRARNPKLKPYQRPFIPYGIILILRMGISRPVTPKANDNGNPITV